jgi:ribonuclease HI
MSGRREHLCYTDGSCKPGDGSPGGWGFHIESPAGEALDGHGTAHDTLAKTMEYRAVAEALAVLPENAHAIVFSDNQPLVNNLAKRLDEWRANEFAKVDEHVVESVRRIDAAIIAKGLKVRWQWVRAHNGNSGNERADALAAQGAREAKAEIARRRA